MKPRKRRNPNEHREKKKPPPEESSSQTTIDDLPESILTHILSFLPTTDAVRTSAIAPPWRNLWHSVPVIDFPMRIFHSRKCRDRSVGYTRKLFAEMLNQWILKRSGNFSVQKFKLSFAYKNYDHIRSCVDSWLKFVISAKAVEMDLDLGGGYFGHYVPDKLGICEKECSDDDDDDEEMNEEDDDDLIYDSYHFDYSYLVNSSVTVLKLRFCDLCPPYDAIKIYSLREIHLDELLIWDEEIEHLMASCVSLEVLSLRSAEFWGDWKIESRSLKHFKFECFDQFDIRENTVQICAPKLETLSLYDSYDGEYFLKEASSLVEVYVQFPDREFRDYACWTNILTSLGGVERLTFQNMWPWCLNYKPPRDQHYEEREKFDPADEICYETFVFHNLKHVELFTAFRKCDILGLELLLQKCPQLETMALVHKYPSFGDVTDMSVVLEMPQLRLVEMKDFQNTENEMFVVSLLKEHGVVLDKIVAYPQAEYDEECEEILLPPFVL